MKVVFLAICTIFSSGLNSFAGQIPAGQSELFKSRSEQKRQQANFEERREALKKLSEVGVRVESPVKRQFLPVPSKPSKEQRKRLLPTAADASLYAWFLERKRTGLIKLFPDLGCEDDAKVLRVDNECLNWIPTSAAYSFRETEHNNGFFADIRLRNGYFISDGFLSQGIIVRLGDVPLETVALDTAGMQFVNDYRPEAEAQSAFKQFLTIVNGIKVGEHVYRNVIKASENTTYAVRSIAYRGKVSYRSGGWVYNILDGDKRIDITVAFRLIRRNNDGSITLLWRELQRQESPKLIVPKKEKAEKT